MKLFFVYNPMSGRGQIRNKLFDIINVFSEAGYEITVHPTRAPKDATAMVTELPDTYDLIVCSGGDGTMDEVVKEKTASWLYPIRYGQRFCPEPEDSAQYGSCSRSGCSWK